MDGGFYFNVVLNVDIAGSRVNGVDGSSLWPQRLKTGLPWRLHSTGRELSHRSEENEFKCGGVHRHLSPAGTKWLFGIGLIFVLETPVELFAKNEGYTAMVS